MAKINCVAAAIALAVISLLVWSNPVKHNECPVYRTASLDWRAGNGLYAHNFGIDGYLYPPQFAILYSPFAIFDSIRQANSAAYRDDGIVPIGDIAWRAAGLVLFMTGLWRLAGAFSRARHAGTFNLLFWLAAPAGLAALRNGQANLQISALMLHIFADLRYENWWRAATWLVIGFFIKPFVAAMILLAGVGYPRLRPRLGVALLLALALPFGLQHPHYAWDQYAAFFRCLDLSANPSREFCNLHGLLAKIGFVISNARFEWMAVVAAVATLGLWLVALRRSNPFRAFFLLALTACYVLLFNPRTESSAYVILSPVIALSAGVAIFIVDMPLVGGGLIAIAFCLVCDGWAYKPTENWLKPLVCFIYFVMLAIEIPQVRPIRLELDEVMPKPTTPQCAAAQ